MKTYGKWEWGIGAFGLKHTISDLTCHRYRKAVCEIDDVVAAPVVLDQVDHVAFGESRWEAGHYRQISSPEFVDALAGITYSEDIEWLRLVGGDGFDHRILDRVYVLKFVQADVSEAMA
ncbi:hypothetical protein D3C75_852910 [compost metagenome]